MGIFRKHSVGITTKHDSLISNVDKKRLIEILNNFYDRNYESKMEEITFVDSKKNKIKGKKYSDKEISFRDGRDFSIEEAYNSDKETSIKNILLWNYRGFEKRFISYYRPLIAKGCDQYTLMQYLFPKQKNIALCLERGVGRLASYSHAFITDSIFEHKVIAGSVGPGSYIFPLKINFENTDDNVEEPKKAIHYNINKKFLNLLPYEATEKEVFFYIYAVLFSNMYRKEFETFLKNEFPRIPFPNNKKLFINMSEKGSELAMFHLLKSEKLRLTDCPYNEHVNKKTRRRILKVNYAPEENRVYFENIGRNDPDTIFWIGGITKDIWDFEIGGIKQINNWLKNRRYSVTPRKNHITYGLRNNDMEMVYLRKMVSAIKNTIILQSKIEQDFTKILDDLWDFDLKNLNDLVEEVLKKDPHRRWITTYNI